METMLTIKCDIKDAQEILYEASKIIQKTKTKPVVQEIPKVISVHEFIGLKHSEMVKYICVESDGNEREIGIFTTRNYISCEMCEEEDKTNHTFLIGTLDSREPKFCFDHYFIINQDSGFIKKGV